MGRIFFASDVHIGVLTEPKEALRLEQGFIKWLDLVASEGEELYLLGDTFDFWFEYKNTIPKGYTSVLAKLRELTHKGIKVHFFHGNHDEWTRDYLESYVGMIIHDSEPEILTLQGKKVMLGHGHKLGLDRRWQSRFLHAIFASRITYRFCEKFFHPNRFVAWGERWSRNNMNSKREGESRAFNPENNQLLAYLANIAKDIDYFIFGHFHTPVEYCLEREYPATLVVLGDWVHAPYYAVMEEGVVKLEKFDI